MKLTQEQFDQLPEFLKGEYAEINGEYQHAGMAKVKQTADNLNAKLEAEGKERQALSARLSTLEATKQQEIEQARAEALAKAKDKGDVSEVEKRYQQQLDDLKKRTAQDKEAGEKRIAALETRIKDKAKAALVADLAAELATDKGAGALKRLLGSRIDIDVESGNAVFLNDDGSASTLDLQGFKDEIQNDSIFAPLLKSGVTTSGGGNANGSGSGGSVNRKFEEYDGAELATLRKQDPAKYQRLVKDYEARQH